MRKIETRLSSCLASQEHERRIFMVRDDSMSEFIYADWNGHHVKLTWYPMKDLSENITVTSVHGYCFSEGKILLVNVTGRGFNVPGGHIENGETVEEAFHREAFEEAYVKGEFTILGS